jgi:hypothetical protein
MLIRANKEKCICCNEKSIEGRMALQFNELIGDPTICIKCIVKILSGKDYDWKNKLNG